MLDLRRLRLLSELVRRGTIAEVATVVGYTPSAVSQSLAQLEREAGIALLERDGRRVRLLLDRAAARKSGVSERELTLDLRPVAPALRGGGGASLGGATTKIFVIVGHAVLCKRPPARLRGTRARSGATAVPFIAMTGEGRGLRAPERVAKGSLPPSKRRRTNAARDPKDCDDPHRPG
jgi:DNA-binding transcriptional ArsR family regulator